MQLVRRNINKKDFINLLILTILIIALPFAVWLVQQVVQYRPKAEAEPLRIFFAPSNVTLPPNSTVKVMFDAKSQQIGFARVVLDFNNDLFELTNEISTTSQLATVIEKTSKAEANSTGKITLVLGLSPDDKGNPPTGIFELAQLPLGPAPASHGISPITVDTTDSQNVNLNVQELSINAEAANITVAPEASPPPSDTPTPTSTNTPPPTDTPIPTNTPPPTPTPYCTVDLTPDSTTKSVGETRQFYAYPANVTQGYSVEHIAFESTNTSSVTLNKSQDSSAPYRFTATAVNPGVSIIRAAVQFNNITGDICEDTSTFIVGSSPTPSPTPTPTPTNTPKSTSTPTPTDTPVPTNTPKASNTPEPTQTPVPKTGDTDGDGDVDIFDYNNLVSNFGQDYSAADFNGNGVVDIFDYNTLVTNFGQ